MNDWQKEKTCEFCESVIRQLPVEGNIIAAMHKSEIEIFSANIYEGSIQINHCPMCGKKLN